MKHLIASLHLVASLHLIASLLLIASVAAAAASPARPPRPGPGVTVQPGMSAAQLQHAINASQPGAIIRFKPGAYNLDGTIVRLPGAGRTYTASGVIIQTHDNPAFDVAEDVGAITGLTLDGGGIQFWGHRSGWSITGNTFQNIVSTADNHAANDAIYGDWVSQFHIDGNTFKNIFWGGKTITFDSKGAVSEHYGDAVFFENGFDQSSFSNNTLDHVNEGIHCFYKVASANSKITNNTFTNIHRIAIEQQDMQIAGLEISGNHLSKPLNGYYATYGISAAQTGTGVHVADNVMNADVPAYSGQYIAYAYEIWGQGTVMERNIAEGYWRIGVGVGDVRAMGYIRNNAFCGPVGATTFQMENDIPGRLQIVTYANNTKSNALTCTLPNPK